MTIGEIILKLGFDVDRNSEDQANNAINGIKNFAKKALGAIAVVFSVKGLASLAEAGANVEALESQFTQVFGDLEQTATQALDSIATQTGVNANRIKSSFVQVGAFAKSTGMDTATALNLSERALAAVADSAAFYDKSIEEVTESMQSYLKGNYSNDAALGIASTETTRNAKANEIYGKSFKNLAEDQKMLTLLAMVEDGNKLSGALGQASRESDTFTNQLGNMQQSFKDLQATVGKGLTKPFVTIFKLISNAVNNINKKLAPAIKELNKEGGKIEKLCRKIETVAVNSVKKIQSWWQKFTKTLGGTENALKLIVIVAGGLFTALNSGAILGFFKSFVSWINLANAKLLLTTGFFALLFLAVDDFINFLKGNDSFIGEMLEKAGIDTDKVREKINNLWQKFKDFFPTISEVKQGISNFFRYLKKTLYEPLKPQFVELFENITNNVIPAVIKAFGDFSQATQPIREIFLDLSMQLIPALTNVLGFLSEILIIVTGNLDVFGPIIIGIVSALWAYKAVIAAITIATKAWSVITKIITAIQTAFNVVMSLNPVMLVYIAILALITVFVVLWNKSEAFRNFFIGMWDGIKKTVAAVGDFFKNGINNVVNFFKKAGSDIKSFFTGVGNWISNTFSTAKEKVITAFTAVGDFFIGIKDGIINAFSNVGEKIGNFVDGAKERIVSGFSAAKETVVGIFDTLGDVLKAPINVAVEAINAVIRGVNKISWDVPDYVPGIGGTTFGFNISEIPKLAKGTIGNERTPDTFIAGEKGAELIIGAKGREVLNHRETNGFFRNIINGINNFKKGENGDILSGFSDLLKGGISPKTSTISTLTESTVNNKIIKQYNNFSNTFNGDKDIQKTANSAMENAEENVVDRLKRALEYS